MGKILGTSGAYEGSIKALEQEKAKAGDAYQSQMYADQTQRSENQAAFRQARDMLAENMANSTGASAVTGGSTAANAAAKAAANKSLENITANVASNASNSRDAAMQNYLKSSAEFTDKINDTKIKQAESESAALQGMMKSMMDTGAAVASGGMTKMAG